MIRFSVTEGALDTVDSVLIDSIVLYNNDSPIKTVSDFSGNVVSYRVVIESKTTENIESFTSIESIDHLKQFEQYVLTSIGNTSVIREELQNVMR